MDLIIRNARLRGQKDLCDIGIQDAKIAALEPKLKATAPRELDAQGRLAAPAFIDPHVHLDKALISEVVRPNLSGTLSEAIEIIWDKKRHYTPEDIQERAGRVIRWAVQNGTLALRSHVDVDTIGGLLPLKALLEVKSKYAHLVDLQLVAFPQEGIYQDPGSEALMREAMELGADVVGGMPYNEMTEEDSRRHIDFAFKLAKAHDADIDMHVDETDDPGARTLQYLAATTIKQDWQGRVTAGHTCALGSYDPYYAAKVIGLVKRANLNMITNPATNLMLEGRRDRGPIRRGLTRVKELLKAGVNVAYGQDCLKDTFYPTFGQADMLEVGLITAHAVPLSMPQEIETLFDMPTLNSARVLRLPDYGLEVGKPASFNILAEETVQEAFRTHLPRRAVIRKGKVLVESRVETVLDPDM